MMEFISLFAGIGGFDLGLETAGMRSVAQVEWNDQATSVLKRHYPNVLHLGDVTHVGKHNLPAVDLICGGFPCTDVSVAGRRAGLAGKSSGYWFEFHRIIHEIKPEWVVIENVPGLLSSNDGKDFAVVLAGLTGVLSAVPKNGWRNAGVARGLPGLYHAAYRVLDARHFGVAQRRRRVFIVASLTTLGGNCAEVLFEQHGGGGDTEESRKAREKTATTTSASSSVCRNTAYTIRPSESRWLADGSDNFIVGTLAASGAGTARAAGQGNELDFLIPTSEIAKTVTSNYGKQADSSDSSTPGNFVAVYGIATTVTPKYGKDIQPTLTQPSPSGGGQPPAVASIAHGVRRLTPIECERLQGFPDNWTALDDKGSAISDSARYRMLGNAVCTNVAWWIGKRIIDTTTNNEE